MSKQEVILCEGLANSLTHAIAKCPHDKLFILSIPTASAARIWTVSPPWKKRKKLLSVQKTYTRIWKRWLPYGKP